MQKKVWQIMAVCVFLAGGSSLLEAQGSVALALDRGMADAATDRGVSAFQETGVLERSSVQKPTLPLSPRSTPNVANQTLITNKQSTDQPSASDSGAAGPRPVASVIGGGVGVERAMDMRAKTPPPMLPPPRAGQSVALMVVGGAALITGVVIGGDGGTLLALGGAVVGLVGLYHYIK